MQLDPDDLTPALHRVKRAQGHLARVVRMMEDGNDCEDVLTQLAAVIKALDKAGFAIVSTGLQQCLAKGDGPDSVDFKKMEKLFLALA
jgi:DNA-binding FrmR family transcriptional regulator